MCLRMCLLRMCLRMCLNSSSAFHLCLDLHLHCNPQDKGSWYVKGQGAEARVMFRGKWKVAWHALSADDAKWKSWGGPGDLVPHTLPAAPEPPVMPTQGSKLDALAAAAAADTENAGGADAITLYAPLGRLLVMQLSSTEPRRGGGSSKNAADAAEQGGRRGAGCLLCRRVQKPHIVAYSHTLY